MTREEALKRCQRRFDKSVDYGWILSRGWSNTEAFQHELKRMGRYSDAMDVLLFRKYSNRGVTTA